VPPPYHSSTLAHPLGTPAGVGTCRIGGGDVEGGDVLAEEGLLGQAAASSRDMSILAPSDSRDGYGVEETRDAPNFLMHEHSLHQMIDSCQARPDGQHGDAGATGRDGSNVHGDTASCQLERLLPDHTSESSILGLNSRDSFGLLKRGREEGTEDPVWQRSVRRDSF